MDYELLNIEGFNLSKGNNTIEVYDALERLLHLLPLIRYVDCVVDKCKPYEEKYLTFEALEPGTFQFTRAGLSYSIDNGENWTGLAANTDTPIVNIGDRIMFKGEMSPQPNVGIGKFTSTGEFNAMGNAMSLLYGDDFINEVTCNGQYCFYGLFYNNTNLVNAENLILPATTLTQYCYHLMFKGCTSLTKAPTLPATTLADNCYLHMFNGCTSLTKAPALPATTLVGGCYADMFEGCTSLTKAPALPATTLADNCYSRMFSGCTSLTTAPSTLPATTLVDDCYEHMFEGCTSLTKAPTLPATTLVGGCYGYMFSGCSNLNYIKAMFTTIPSGTNNWVSGVAATGTFVKNSAATWDVTGVNGVPTGWTVETASE